MTVEKWCEGLSRQVESCPTCGRDNFTTAPWMDKNDLLRAIQIIRRQREALKAVDVDGTNETVANALADCDAIVEGK